MVLKKFFDFAFSAFRKKQHPVQVHETHLKDVKIVKSFRPIHSDRAQKIFDRVQGQTLKTLGHDSEVEGKKSLAWVLWAFKTAADANYEDGISVHDVSALVYQAGKVELYPINISRVVHKHSQYIRQVSQDKKTKRYLLTDEGVKVVEQLSLN